MVRPARVQIPLNPGTGQPDLADRQKARVRFLLLVYERRAVFGLRKPQLVSVSAVDEVQAKPPTANPIASNTIPDLPVPRSTLTRTAPPKEMSWVRVASSK